MSKIRICISLVFLSSCLSLDGAMRAAEKKTSPDADEPLPPIEQVAPVEPGDSPTHTPAPAPADTPANVLSDAPAPDGTPKGDGFRPGSRTLIIGDSHLGSDGAFGPAIARALSMNGGDVCMFNVSSSKFSDWVGTNFTESKQDSNVQGYNDGSLKGSEKYWNPRNAAQLAAERKSGTKDTADRGNWSLKNILETRGKPNPKGKTCSTSGAAFENLVINLGTNDQENENISGYIDMIYGLAAQHQVKNVKFILPPDSPGKSHKNSRASIMASIARHKGSTADAYDSNKLAFKTDEFADKDGHLKKTAHIRWANGVTSWLGVKPSAGLSGEPQEAKINHAT